MADKLRPEGRFGYIQLGSNFERCAQSTRRGARSAHFQNSIGIMACGDQRPCSIEK
jgi:hypothetical protein